MNYVFFDIETKNIFSEVGGTDSTALDISVACACDGEKCIAATEDELHLLWPMFERADALVGYNSDHFDIPLLNKYYPGDLTQIKSIDLLVAIKESLGRRLRLDAVAKATIKAKKSADGLAAVKWWREGEIQKIKDYCTQDVQVTKKLFEYALEHGHVKFKDGARFREIPLDTTGWTDTHASSLTHSLPF